MYGVCIYTGKRDRYKRILHIKINKLLLSFEQNNFDCVHVFSLVTLLSNLNLVFLFTILNCSIISCDFVSYKKSATFVSVTSE